MANGITKSVTSVAGNEIIVGDLKIITHASGVSINALPLDTIKVIDSLSCNTDTIPALPAINSLNPGGVANKSVAYFDAGVE